MNQQNSQMTELNEVEKLKRRIAELESREKQLLKNLRLNISLHSKILDALPINIF
jgi:hypothetical protein